MKKSEKEIYILQEQGQKNEKRMFLTEAVITVLLLSGLLLSIRALSDSNVCILTGISVGILVTVFLQAAQWIRGEDSYKAKTAIYLICFLTAMFFLCYLSQGFFEMADQFILLWNLRFGSELERFAVGNGVEAGSVILWGLSGAVLSGILLTQIQRQKMAVAIPVILIATFLNFVIGDGNLWGMVLLLLGFCEMFTHYSAPGRTNGFKGFLCLIGFLALFGVVFGTTGNYTEVKKLEQWKKNAAEGYEKLRYGDDTLPQGDLKKASGLLHGEEQRLHLTMDQPKELYLKGFVGADFTGQNWKEVSAEAYQGDYEGILQWLLGQGLDPVTQYSSYQNLTDEITQTQSDAISVSVENTGAYRKYVYLPSAVSGWSAGGTKEKKDWQVRSKRFFGCRSYQFEMPQSAQTADQIIPQSWLEQTDNEAGTTYLEAESVYHGFVEDRYLELTDEQKPFLQEQIFGNQNLDDLTFSELTTQIRQALRTQIRYTESPQSVTSGQKFLPWLLQDYKKGNAVYFATAAVLAYRAAGYPARYVEGYHFSDQEADRMKEDGQSEMDLTSKNAHAWAEVYITGIGWMPVEVVPGMYVESYSNQLVSGKPAYQISSMPDVHGMDTKDDGIQGISGEQGADDASNEKITWSECIKTAIAGVLVFLYSCFFVYLILELQRCLRIRRKAAEKEQMLSRGQPAEEYYIKEIRRLFMIAGMKESMLQPKEEKPDIEKTFPGVYKREYERTAQLLQRAVFGRKKLKVYEQYTLDCFIRRVSTALYQKQSFVRKMILRYVYIVQR